MLDRWLGKSWRRPSIGPALHAGATQGLNAVPDLRALAADGSQAAPVRATAANLLTPSMRAPLLPAVRELLKDTNPEVRIAALAMIETADLENRLQPAVPLLRDPVRGVRIEAARVLAGIPEERMPVAARDVYRRVLDEYIISRLQEADWPAASCQRQPR